MATSFQDIYDMFLNETKDSDLAYLPSDLYYERLWNFLKVGISIFDKRCYKDLNDRISYQRKTYKDIISTVDGTIIIPLEEAPIENGEFYISVNSEEISDYYFDENIETIQIKNIKIGDIIVISSYIKGQFNLDLNYTEMNILKTCMLFSYDNYKSHFANLTNLQIFGKDFNLHSPANTLKTVMMLNESQYKIVENEIVKYSYFHADGEVYRGMGG